MTVNFDMKIAYLIITHNQPEHLLRLVKALNSDQAVCFIHVDLKSDISHFSSLISEPKVIFLDDRVSVNHGGFSLTQSMINLLQVASESGHFDYFVFLSGYDYPIKDDLYIQRFFQQNYPTNFINFYPLIKGSDQVTNINNYHFVDLLEYQPRFLKKPLPRIFRKPFYALYYALRWILPERRFLQRLTPYRGSQWFSLNRETVEYILNFLKTREGFKYKNFFKYVWGSDEIFFQTLVLNSEYATQCRYYARDILHSIRFMKNENKAYLHYIDWSKRRENPAILDMRDLQKLRESEFLFARKFSEKLSKELLDFIDREILNSRQSLLKNQNIEQ